MTNNMKIYDKCHENMTSDLKKSPYDSTTHSRKAREKFLAFRNVYLILLIPICHFLALVPEILKSFQKVITYICILRCIPSPMMVWAAAFSSNVIRVLGLSAIMIFEIILDF